MTLIIQIALGILLGYILILALPFLLRVGGWLLIIAILGSVVAGVVAAVMWLKAEPENLVPLLVFAVFIGPMVYHRVTLTSRVEKRNREARKKAGYS
jgi:energy-coupling factor transporter transmembrane protein EcfT